MVFAGEASWRWQMMLPSTDTSYETFWRQSVRWLALGATDPVAIYPPAAGGPGDEFTVRAVVRDSGFAPLRNADVDIRVSGPDGRMETLGAALEEEENEEARRLAEQALVDANLAEAKAEAELARRNLAQAREGVRTLQGEAAR